MNSNDIINQILESRGYTTNAEQQLFLKPDYVAGLDDPLLLKDMAVAVKRLKKAKAAGETVGIFGDYDIDGLTATALLSDAFGSFGIKTVQHIPNRFDEGYGMSREGLDELKKQGASLVITVDCGSTSVDEVAYATKIDLEVIVTDHHDVPKKLPKAVAVINPKRPDSKYPYKELAGVGVAFKLVQALQSELSGLPDGQEKWLLDLVALGTVCDVVPLVSENRSLVYWGLKVLEQTRRPGLKALADVSQVELFDVKPSALGFGLGPRLNAAGRLDSARGSLELLMSTDIVQSRQKAKELDDLNADRQAQQKNIFEAAKIEARRYLDDDVLVLNGDDWNEGVIGIVASKIMEEFKKPVFMIANTDDDLAKGSARSFGDFSIVDAIRANDTLLEKGGGHKMAGGLTIKQSKVDTFRTKVNEFYKKLNLTDQLQHLLPSADIELDTVDPLDLELARRLQQFQPFGMGNPEPRFELENIFIKERRSIGQDGKHLKLKLGYSGPSIDAIGFNMGARPVQVGDRLNVVGKLRENNFNGTSSPQIIIDTLGA